nr:MARTX multifunctional-autoprocessing repeats-in-toxin holotoxin RtxA [Vibrio anguillarum]
MGKPFWRSVEYFFTGNYSADDGNNDIVAIGFGGEIHAYGGDDHIHLGSIGATVYTGSGNDTVSAGAGYLKVEDTTGSLSVRGAAGYADIKKNGDGNLSFSGAAGGVDIGHDGQHGNISYAGAAAYNHIKRQGLSGHVSFQGAGGYNAIWHETNHGNLSFEGAGAGNKIDRTWFNQYQGSQGDVRFVGAGVANSISSRVESGNLHFSGAGADNHLVRKGKVGDITLQGAGASNRIERTHQAEDVYTQTRGNIRFEGVGGYNSLYSDVAHGDIHFSGGGAYNTITRKGSGGDFDAQGMEYAKAEEIVLTTAQMHGISIDNGNKFHSVNAVKSEREPNTYLFAIADGTYTKINKIRLYNDAESGKLKYYSEAWFKQGNHLTDLAHSDVSSSGGFESNPVNGGYTLSNIAIEHQQSVTVHAVEKSLTEYEWVTYANGAVIDAKDVSLSDAKMGGHAIYADGTKVDVKAVKSNRKPNTYVYAKVLGPYTKIVVVELANDAETGALKYQARSWYKEGDHTANIANQDISSATGYNPMGKGGYSLSDLHYSVNAVRSTSETVADIDEYTDQTLFKPVSDSGESSGDVHFNGVGGGNVIKSNVTRGHVYFNGGGLANLILHSSQFGNTEFNGAGAANVIVKSGEEGDLTFRGAGLANVLVHQSQQGKMDVYAGGALNVLVRVGNGDYLAHLLAYGNISVQKGQGNSRVTLLGGYNTHTQIGSGDALWLAAGGFNVMTQVGQGDVASVLAGGANVLTKMGDGELTAGMLGGANVITHISSDDQLSNTTAVALGGANILTKKGKGNTLAVMGGGANVLTHVGDGTTTGVMVGGANILTKVGNGDTTGIMLGVGNVLTHVGDGQTLGVMGAAGNIFTKVGDGTSIAVMIGAGNIFTHVGEGNAWALMGGLGNVFTKVGNGDALALMVAEANVFTHIGDGMSVALMLAKGNIATKVGNGTTLAAMVGNANIFTHVGSGSTFAAMIGQANIMTKVGDDLTAALMVGKANIYTHVGDGTSLGIFAGEVNVMTKVGNGTTLAAMFGKANIMTHVGDGLTGVLALGEANIVTKVGDDFMGVVAAAKANVVTHVGDATTAAVLAGKGNILTKVGEGTTVGLLISDIGNVMTHVGDGTTIGIAKGKANIITKVGDGLGVNVAWGQANVFTHVGDGDRYNFAKGEANVISKVGDGQEVSVVQGQANIITHVGDGDDYTGAWGKANVITKVGNGRNVVLAKGEANIVTQVGDGDSFNALWSKGNIVTKVGDGMQVTAAKGKANVTTRVGDGLNVTAAYGDANINTVVGDGISVNVAWGQYNVNTKIGDGLNVAVMKGKANANIHVGDGLGVNASYAQNNVAIKIGNGDFYSLAVASSNTSSNKLSALFDNIKQTVLGVGGSQAINYLVQGDEASSSGTHKGRGAIATPEITKLDGFQMEAIEEVGSDLGDSLTGSVTKVDTPDLNKMQNALNVDDSSDQVQGPNLIVNGDFEQSDFGWSSTHGVEAYVSASSYGLERDGHGDNVSELATDQSTTIYQDIQNLTEGEVIAVSFDFAKRAGISNNEGIDVLWNGEVVFSSSGDESAWQQKTLKLTAHAGSNRIEFKGTGHDDGLGYILDNVVAKSETPQQTNAVSEHATQNQASQNALADKDRAEADRQRLEQEKQKQLDAVAGSQSQLESTDQQALGNNGQAQRDAVQEESEAITAELTKLAQGLDVLDSQATHTGESGDQWRNNFAGGLLDGVQSQLDDAKQVSGEQIAAAKQTHADNQNKVKDSVAQSEAGVAKGEQNLAGAEQDIADAKTDAEKRKADALAKGNDAKQAESDAHSAANDAQSRGDRDAMNAENKANQVQNDAKGAKQNESDRPDRQGVAGSGLAGQAHNVEAAGAAGHINADSQANADGRFSEGLSEQELEALEGATNAVNRLQINAGIRAKNTGSSVTSMFTETNGDSIVVPTTASQDVVRKEIRISGVNLEGLGEASSDIALGGNAIDNMLRDSLPFYSLRAERNLLVQEGDEGLEVRAWPGTDDNSKTIILDDPEDTAQQKAIERFILANFDNFEQMPDELFLVDNKVISHHEGRTRVLAQKEEGAWKYNIKAELMSVTELLDAASVTGKVRGESYQQVIDALAEYHLSTVEHADYEQESMEKLVNLRKQVEGYLLGHPDSGRVEAMSSLLNQVNVRLEEVSVLSVAEQSIKTHDSFSRLYDQLDNAKLKESKHLYLDGNGDFITKGKGNLANIDQLGGSDAVLEKVKAAVSHEYGQAVADTIFAGFSANDLAKDGKGIDIAGLNKVHQAIEQHMSPVSATMYIWKPSDHSTLGHAALQIGQGRTQLEGQAAADFNKQNYVSWWPLGSKSSNIRNIFNVATKNQPDLKLRWSDFSQPAHQNDTLEHDMVSEENDGFGLNDGETKLKRFIEKLNAAKGIDASYKDASEGYASVLLGNPDILETTGIPTHVFQPFVEQWNDTSYDMMDVANRFAEELQKQAQASGDPALVEKRIVNVVRQFAERALEEIKAFKASEADQGRVFRINLEGLDTAAMQAEWHRLSNDPDARYQLLTKNCSSTVAKVLKAGGADKLIGHTWLPKFGVWTPTELFNFGQALQEAQLDIVAKKQNLRNTELLLNDSSVDKAVASDTELGTNTDSSHRNYQSRDLVLEPIVQPETIELGMPDIDQKILAEVAERENVIIGVRPVDEKSKSLIDSKLYSSKGLFVKAKSSDWGPMSGFIPVDQSFAKASARRDLDKFNGYAEQSIESGNAVSADLYLNQVRIDELVSKYQSLAALELDAESGMYKTTATNGDQTVTFFLNKVTVESKDLWQVHYMKDGELAPFKVIGDPVSKQPMTADYDLLTVMYSYAELGPQDKVKQPLTWEQWKESVTYEDLTPKYQELYDSEVLYNKKDGASLGVVSDRLKTLKDVINTSLGRTDGLEMVHHGADDANPYAVMADNFPATFFVPKSFFMEDGLGEGKGSIQTYFNVNEQGAVVIRDPQEFSNFQQVAINVSYRASLNDKWNAGLDDPLFTPERKLSHDFLNAREDVIRKLSGEIETNVSTTQSEVTENAVMQPLDFSKVFTREELVKSANVFGKRIGSSYQAILEQVDLVHRAVDRELVLESFKLNNKIIAYLAEHPTSGRNQALTQLKEQVTSALFIGKMQVAQAGIDAIAQTRPELAARIFMVAIEEANGKHVGLTDMMVRWANEDPYLAPKQGYKGGTPSDLAFDAKYHVDLGEHYADFKQWLETSQSNGLLSKALLDEATQTVHLGYSYQELQDLTGVESVQMAFYFLKEAAKKADPVSGDSAEMILLKKFADQSYLTQLNLDRMDQIEGIYRSSHETDVDAWDSRYSGVGYDELSNKLAEKNSIEEQLSVLLDERKGLLIGEVHGSDVNGLRFVNEQMDALKKQGISVIGLEHLRSDLAQPLIDSYLATGVMSSELSAMLKTKHLDVTLFENARANGMRVVALDANSSARPNVQGTEHGLMYRAGAANNIAVEILQNLPDGEKFVAIYGKAHLQSHKGIEGFVPGITHRLDLPALKVSDSNQFTIEQDDVSLRVVYDDVANKPKITFKESLSSTNNALHNQDVDGWERVVVTSTADGGETRFDGQVIVQMENDSVVAKAAANLAGKHPENSVVVQLDSEGNYRVVYGDPSKLDGKLRWQLVGHGRDDSEHNNSRLSGYSADELAVKLAKFQQAFGQAENISNKPDHISIVGCSLVSDDKQKGFGHQFINAMDANGLRVDVSVRNSDVAVDTTGRKHTQDANGNWVQKAENNKVSLTWNTQGEVTARDEIIRNGVAEGDIHLARVGASEVNEPARGAIGDNSEVFEAPEKRKTETDTTASAGSDNKLSYSGNIQVNVGDGEFTAVNWGTSNVGIKVGTGGFKSLAFGDNNVMVHIGNGDSKHSVDIAGYQALEGAQMFMGNRNVSFNMGRSNDLIVMMDKSIPTPPLVNPFDGASRISGVLQSIAQSGKGTDWLAAQEQQWTLSGAKKFVKEMSGLDQTSSVDYTSLVDLDSQNERSSRGLKSDAEATLNKKYNQWLSGNSNNDTGKMSRADKFRQMNEKLAFNFAVGGQGADIQVTTGNWNFMFGDNIQAILDTNLGSLFGVLTQQFSATGMAQTTFTYNPQDLPRQLKNKLLGKFAEVGAETTLGDIFGVNYTADGKIVSRTDEAVDGVAILKEMLEVIGEFGGEQLSAFTDPEKLLDSLKAGIDMGADGLQSFTESHGLKEKAPEENDTAQVTLNGAPAATENVSATVEESKPERAFGFNALNLPNVFATMFSKDKQTEMASLVSNLKQNLTADLLNMKDKTFDFLRNSGHLQGDGDMNVSLGNYNFNWGGDGKDLGAYLGDNNNFWGGRGDDVFYATGVSNIFTGGEGHDMGVLMGRENMMFGGDGNDTAVVAGRINHVFMGAGDDQSFVFGEGGEITMGSGNDYAVTSGNFNRVDMGDDQDFAVTIGNNNQLDLGAGNDFARVFGNHNRIDAGQGNDEVKLMGYHASINAGEGEDYLIAAAISKFSTLNGGEGNDVMVLGGYQNTFKGGAGVDSFVVSGEVIDNVVEDIRQGENIIFNGIDWNRLWFERSGYDLKISMARHTDTSSDQTLFDALGCVTFNDYFANNRAKLIIGLGEKDAQGEQEYTCLTDNALDNLIQAMSSFAPKVGESNFMDGLASQPQQAIMAAWSDVNTGKFSLS